MCAVASRRRWPRAPLIVAIMIGLGLGGLAAAFSWRWHADQALAHRAVELADRLFAQQKRIDNPGRQALLKRQPNGRFSAEDTALLLKLFSAPADWRVDLGGPPWEPVRALSQLDLDRTQPEPVDGFSGSPGTNDALLRFARGRLERNVPERDAAKLALQELGPFWLARDPLPLGQARALGFVAGFLRDRDHAALSLPPCAGCFDPIPRELQVKLLGWSLARSELIVLIDDAERLVGDPPTPIKQSKRLGLNLAIPMAESIGAVLFAWSLEAGETAESAATKLESECRHLRFRYLPQDRVLRVEHRLVVGLEDWPRHRIVLKEPASGRPVTIIAGPRSDHDLLPEDRAERDGK
jgi:hypothetical protein